MIIPLFTFLASSVRRIRCSSKFFCSPKSPIEHNVIPYLKEGDPPVTSKSLFGIKPIGIVVSPHIKRFNAPKQATIEKNGQILPGYIQIFSEYTDCLHRLDEFDYCWAITYMHYNSGFKSKIIPQPNPALNGAGSSSDSTPPSPSVSTSVGLFCSRSPHRPNPLALSALKITTVNMCNGTIHVEGLDLLNGTPVMDIKPYVPAFDSFPDARSGWMDTITSDRVLSRRLGYQNIVSSRGARATRAGNRKRNQSNERIESPSVPTPLEIKNSVNEIANDTK